MNNLPSWLVDHPQQEAILKLIEERTDVVNKTVVENSMSQEEGSRRLWEINREIARLY